MVDGREHEAALVASRLKAFLASPAMHRPRYARGEEPLPDGAFVLRYAQGRLGAGGPGAEAQLLERAARAFIRDVCLREGSDHYHVLCARRDASAETIKEHYHLLMALLHPDRQESSATPWPAGCAQRVNVAYATLGDEKARRDYDVSLPSPSATARAAPPDRSVQRASRDMRFARTLLVASMVTAAVVAVLATSYEDEWTDDTLMESAIAALRLRSAVAAERPRYVGAAPVRASDAAAEEPAAFSFFKPLMARLTPKEPVAWAPAPVIVARAEEARMAIPPAAPTPAAPLPPTRMSESSTPPVAAPSLRLAQAPSVPRAQAATPAPAAKDASAGPSSVDIENLVAALVGYYEAGDADKLVGLLDTRQAGFWRTAQLRQSYEDFFRATRARRLRVERLAWDSGSGTASAKGEATVIAEYFDSNAPVERHVPLEVDVGMRDGRALITRLALFPAVR